MELSDIIWTPRTYGGYIEASKTIGITGAYDSTITEFGVLSHTIGYEDLKQLMFEFHQAYLAKQVRYFDRNKQHFVGIPVRKLTGEIADSIVLDVGSNPRNEATMSLEFGDKRDPIDKVSVRFQSPRVDIVRFNGVYILGELRVPDSYFLDFGISSSNARIAGCWNGESYKHIADKFDDS